MQFHSDGFPVPDVLRADAFIFRPLRASDVELDYDAVISSSRMLRARSQSDWPADGFTLEENLVDLERHEQEHLDRNAFTYTIMNPEETLCLGCIYVTPLIKQVADLGVCQRTAEGEDVFAASVRYWIRESHATKELNSTVLVELIQWLDREWYFNCVVFPVAEADSAQSELLIERGLVLVGSIYGDRRGSRWSIYQKGPK